MKKTIKEVAGGLKSLAVGMRITLGEFFKPTVTVHYPHETLKIPPRFRGHIELVRDPDTGKAVCFSCKLCERACPSDCITVEGVKPEGSKKKTVSKYILDFTKCSLCGSCVEACRDGAIRFSRDYNLAGVSKEDFVMDLFARLQEEAKREGIIIERPVEGPTTPPTAKPAPAAASATQAAATTAPATVAVKSPPAQVSATTEQDTKTAAAAAPVVKREATQAPAQAPAASPESATKPSPATVAVQKEETSKAAAPASGGAEGASATQPANGALGERTLPIEAK